MYTTHAICRSSPSIVNCFGSEMSTSSQSKRTSSSASHSPSPASISSASRRTRDSGLCMTNVIPEIPANCIVSLNSQQLGQGSYGMVEKIKYRKSRGQEYRPAAIKYSSPIHLRVLIREAKVMWALRDHKNITQIYGLYKDSRHGYGVVMEYMDCGCMADLVYKRKNIDYTIDHAASWLYQLSSAVHTFHSNDQVHRDLKLQNILLCNQYRTMKLCDFGTFTPVHDYMTKNIGTPITMAPEVFRCEPYNQKSDIYSIGIIMWQIISRNDPYNRNFSVQGLLFNVAAANLRPHDIDCNPILSGFYKRCWDDNPDIRPTSDECVKYFEIFRSQFPHGDVPLADKSINVPAEIPPPPPPRNSKKALPPPIEHRKDINEEKRAVFRSIMSNEATRPIDPDARDAKSIEIYHDHCQNNEELTEVLVNKKYALRDKHELQQRWPQHEYHDKLLEHRNFLQQEIAKLQRNRNYKASVITERL